MTEKLETLNARACRAYSSPLGQPSPRDAAVVCGKGRVRVRQSRLEKTIARNVAEILEA